MPFPLRKAPVRTEKKKRRKERKEKGGKRRRLKGERSFGAPWPLILSLFLPEENDDAAEEEAEGWRRPRAGKTRIPGQRVESFSICGSRADVARCFHWKMHFHGAGEMKETRLFLCFEHSFSISLSLSLNSLLLRFKPRPFFFEHGFSSSTRASGKNRSRERIFHGERSLRLARFPHDYSHSPAFLLASI